MSDAVLIALITGVPPLIAAIMSGMTTLNRRTRARANRLARSVDQAEEYILMTRRAARVHNEHFHSDDDDALIIDPLPGFMVKFEEEA